MVDMNHKIIGVFGGTFDPVHNGHIEIAKNLTKTLKLEAIHFVTNRHPPHRNQPIASAKDRFAMLKLAIGQQKKFIANDVELQRSSPSYMIETLKILKKQFRQESLCLIIGSDAFAHFNQWHHWQDIFSYAHLLIINRNHIDNDPAWMQSLLTQRLTQDISTLAKKQTGFIYLHYIKPIPISATEIRSKLAAHQDVSHLLPAAVLNYIYQNKLYEK